MSERRGRWQYQRSQAEIRVALENNREAWASLEEYVNLLSLRAQKNYGEGSVSIPKSVVMRTCNDQPEKDSHEYSDCIRYCELYMDEQPFEEVYLFGTFNDGDETQDCLIDPQGFVFILEKLEYQKGTTIAQSRILRTSSLRTRDNRWKNMLDDKPVSERVVNNPYKTYRGNNPEPGMSFTQIIGVNRYDWVLSFVATDSTHDRVQRLWRIFQEQAEAEEKKRRR